MTKIYIVSFSWGEPEDNIRNNQLYAFSSYEKAYNKFYEIIKKEQHSNTTWIGKAFKGEYEVVSEYDYKFETNNNLPKTVKVDRYWNIYNYNNLAYENIQLKVIDLN